MIKVDLTKRGRKEKNLFEASSLKSPEKVHITIEMGKSSEKKKSTERSKSGGDTGRVKRSNGNDYIMSTLSQELNDHASMDE